MDEFPRYDELLESRNRWRAAAWLWFVLFLIALSFHLFARPAGAAAQSPETRAAANADRDGLAAVDWGYTFYLTTDALPDVRRQPAERVTAFAVSSFSRSVVLEHHLPAHVVRGLSRIDLRGLQWSRSDWDVVMAKYPYAPQSRPLPLIVRADWLVVQLADNFESDAGYRLLYGGRQIPQTRDDFLRAWQVNWGGSQDPLLLAHVEKESGVSLLRLRRIENRPSANRGYAWGTEDNARRNLSALNDPLETLLGSRKHDAEEWIVGFPKISATQGAGGTAQAYLLANGDGKRQDRAPVDIVEDTTRFRGAAEIRNSGSCIACHAEGIKPLAKNDLRDAIARGVEVFADKRSQQLIEQQYLADTRLRIEAIRNQEDYTTFVLLCTGWSPSENVRAFRQLIDDYDRPLTLEDAARELYVTPQELTHAFGYASTRQIKLGARLSDLPHGGTIDRAYWESQFSVAWSALELWKDLK